MSGVALAAGATGPLQHVPQSLQPLINEQDQEADHRAKLDEQQPSNEQSNHEWKDEASKSVEPPSEQLNSEQPHSGQMSNEQTNRQMGNEMNNEINNETNNETTNGTTNETTNGHAANEQTTNEYTANEQTSHEHTFNEQRNNEQVNNEQMNNERYNSESSITRSNGEQPNGSYESSGYTPNGYAPSISGAPSPNTSSAPASDSVPAPGPAPAPASVPVTVTAPAPVAPASIPVSNAPAPASDPVNTPVANAPGSGFSTPASDQQPQSDATPVNGAPQAIAPKTELQADDQANESDSVRLHRRQAPHIQVRPGATICQNCFTTTTPLWRRDETGQIMCNACGLFLKLHGRRRPISLKTDVIKSRNRSNRQNRMDRHNAARRKQMATPVAVQSVHSQNLAIRQAQQAQQQAEKQAQRQARHQAQQQAQHQLLQQSNVTTGPNGAPELVRTDTNSPMQSQQQQSLSPRTQQQTPLPPQQPHQIPGMAQIPGMPPHLASVLHHPLNGLPGLASSLASLPLMYPGAQGLNYLGAQGINPQGLNPQGMMMNSPILGPQGGPISQSPHLAPGSHIGMAPLGQPLSPQIVAQTGGGPMLTNRMPARGAMSELLLPCSPDLIDRIPHLAQIPVAQFQQQSEQQQQEQARVSIAHQQRSQQNSPQQRQQLSSDAQNYAQLGQKENKRSITPPSTEHSTVGPNTPSKSPSGLNSHSVTPLSTNDAAQLTTRVSELELVNDLLRRRVQDLEASELQSRQQVEELKSQLAKAQDQSTPDKSAQDHSAQHPPSPLSKRIKVSELV